MLTDLSALCTSLVIKPNSYYKDKVQFYVLPSNSTLYPIMNIVSRDVS